MGSFDALDILDRAYAVHQPTSDWLRGVAEAVCAVADHGRGLLAFSLSSAANGSPELSLPTPAGVGDFWPAWFEEMKAMPHELQRYGRLTPALTYKSHFTTAAIAAVPAFQMYVDQTFRARLVDPPRTAREIIERDIERGVAWAECLAMHASDGTDHDLFFVLPCPQQKHDLPSLQEVEHWARVMAHVSNAWRLHRDLRARGRGPLDAADAVLAPNGAILDIDTEEAMPPEVRAVLSDAVKVIERHRATKGKASPPPERILAERLALVAGQWSLVDAYDSDGKRFVTARRNDEGWTVPALSDRQRQIAVHLARGHSNKLMAYQLGISIGTVTTHVRRLAEKLDTDNRVQLVAACQMMVAFDPMSFPR